MDPKRFLLVTVAFEQWLRFAWLDEDLRIRVPEETVGRLTARFPELLPLLTRLTDAPAIDGETSTLAVMDLAEKVLGRTALPGILDDPEFQNDVYAFQNWVRCEGEHATADPSDFAVWFTAFLKTRI